VLEEPGPQCVTHGRRPHDPTTQAFAAVDPNAPAAARVRAADCVLARGNEGLQREDLEVRLAALERAAAQERGGA